MAATGRSIADAGQAADYASRRTSPTQFDEHMVGIASAEWRMGRDSNPRNACTSSGFQDRRLKPLGHPSDWEQSPRPLGASIPLRLFAIGGGCTARRENLPRTVRARLLGFGYPPSDRRR